MRRYETIFIADPDLNDKDQISLFDKIKTLIAHEKGILVDFDEWGNKQLAYEIRKKVRGYYVCITYGGTGELVAELERNFRLDDRVLKFMTIVLAKDVDPLALQQEKKAEDALNEKNSAKTELKSETKTEDTHNSAKASVEEIEAAPEVETESAPVTESESVTESIPESGQKEVIEDSQLTEEEK